MKRAQNPFSTLIVNYRKIVQQIKLYHSKKEQIGYLTLSRRRPISYRNQSIDLQSKSIDWFLYDIGLRRERVKDI